MPIPDWEVEGTMEHAQRVALEKALVAERFSVARAALKLRIGRSTTYRLIKKYGIPMPAEGELPQAHPPYGGPATAQRPAGSGSEIVFDGVNFLLVKR